MRTGGSTIYGERPARRPAADRRYARCDKGALEEGGPGVAVLASPEDGAPGRPAAPSKTWPIRRHTRWYAVLVSRRVRFTFRYAQRQRRRSPGVPGSGLRPVVVSRLTSRLGRFVFRPFRSLVSK